MGLFSVISKLAKVFVIAIALMSSPAQSAITMGPYLQIPTQNSIMVRWWDTNGAIENPRVTVPLLNRTFPATQTTVYGNLYRYDSVISPLTRENKYDYTIYSGSEYRSGKLQASPPPNQKVLYAVHSDTQDDTDEVLVISNRYTSKNPDYTIITGDVVDDGNQKTLWQNFFNAEKDLLKSTGFRPAEGNHENHAEWDTKLFEWNIPTGVTKSTPTAFESVDQYGNALMVTLGYNCIWGGPGCTEFLTSAMNSANSETVWKILNMHAGVYNTYNDDFDSAGWHTSGLLQNLGVDFVFGGHAHIYERVKFEDPTFNDKGIQFLNLAAAGGMLRTSSPSEITAKMISPEAVGYRPYCMLELEGRRAKLWCENHKTGAVVDGPIYYCKSASTGRMFTCPSGSCTIDGQCYSGPDLCTGVVCPTQVCKTGICNPTTGQCVYTNSADGTSCGGNNVCMNGVCGNNLCSGIICSPQTCKTGTCNPSTGQCTYSNSPDGTSCGTSGQICKAGICTSLPPLTNYYLTFYWIALESDFPGVKNTNLLTCDGQVIATVTAGFAESIGTEGTGKLDDGRVLNFGESYGCYVEIDQNQFPYGIGSNDNPLVPFVSIATNAATGFGSTVYIREFDGLRLPNGKIHNGCVRVDDECPSCSSTQMDFFSLSEKNYMYIEGITTDHVNAAKMPCTVLDYMTDIPVDPCLNVNCGAHGTCNSSNGLCACRDGWTGINCQIPPVTDPCLGVICSEQVCKTGVCVNPPGYCVYTNKPENTTCPGGSCQLGICVQAGSCYDVTGKICMNNGNIEIILTPSGSGNPCDSINCGPHGTCNEGVCICKDQYTGQYCEIPPIIVDPCIGVNCGSHGNCVEGNCICTDGWSGINCQIPPSSDPCDGILCNPPHGTCFNGKCECTDQYTGVNCEIPPVQPRNGTILMTYVDQLTEWWPPTEIAKSMGVPTFATPTFYNTFSLPYWKSNGVSGMVQVWNNAVTNFGPDSVFGATTPEIQQSLVDYYHSEGKKVLMAAFGYAEPNVISSGKNAQAVCTELANAAKINKFDGVDLVIEDDAAVSTGTAANWLITCTNTIRSILPSPQYLLIHSPKASYMSADYTGGYRRVNNQVGPKIDFYNFNFYNQDSYETYETLFKSNPTGTAVKQINNKGVPMGKIVVGKPATSELAWGGGYMNPTNLASYFTKAKTEIGWNTGFSIWEYMEDEQQNFAFINTCSASFA